jgi:hypothetical protein
MCPHLVIQKSSGLEWKWPMGGSRVSASGMGQWRCSSFADSAEIIARVVRTEIWSSCTTPDAEFQ